VLHRIRVLYMRIENGEYVDDAALDIIRRHDLAEIVIEERPLQIGGDYVLLRQGRPEWNVGSALCRLPHRAGLLGAEHHSESTTNYGLVACRGIVGEAETRSQIDAGIGVIR